MPEIPELKPRIVVRDDMFCPICGTISRKHLLEPHRRYAMRTLGPAMRRKTSQELLYKLCNCPACGGRQVCHYCLAARGVLRERMRDEMMINAALDYYKRKDRLR